MLLRIIHKKYSGVTINVNLLPIDIASHLIFIKIVLIHAQQMLFQAGEEK